MDVSRPLEAVGGGPPHFGAAVPAPPAAWGSPDRGGPRAWGGPRPRGGAQPRLGSPPSAAPGAVASERSGIGGAWREACDSLQNGPGGVRDLREEIGRKRSEAQALREEVASLRDRLSRERAETEASVERHTVHIERLEFENRKLQSRLMTASMSTTSQDGDVDMMTREIREKTEAIESVMRELQQQQQAALGKISSLANAMLTSCTPPSSVVDHRGGASAAAGDVALGGSAGSRSAPAGPRGAEEQTWLQSVKDNLEHFGDVDVFVDSSARDCACCLELMNTPYRIRPRKCGHVFHIECLLQSWTEGVCPVCGVSFAPDGQTTGAADANSVPSEPRDTASRTWKSGG